MISLHSFFSRLEGFSGFPYLYCITIRYAVVLVLLQGSVLAQQYVNLGGEPVTVEVVFSNLKRFIVKIVEDSDNRNMGYNGTYVCDTSMCY